MASNNQIVKKSIQIDAGDTVRTVRSLKQEIADLRDQLLNLEQGTEEYDAVQKQLTEDVEDLNTVMGAHKDKAQALEGSYNDLQNQLKELKAAWKATNDEADRDVLGQRIKELNDQLSAMDQSIGDFHRNVGNYQSAWDGLSGVMERNEKITDDLEKGIKAFGTALGLSEEQANSLSSALKRMKDGFKIAKDITKAREETTKLATAEAQAATQGTALATSQTATGTAAKAMAAGETAAAGATKGLSVAMKGLKAALISTGIGALVVLLGSLTSALERAYSKSRQARIEAINQGMMESARETIRLTGIIQAHSETLEFERRKMEARGASEQKLLEQRIKDIETLIEKQTEVTEKAWNDAGKKEQEINQLSKRKQKEQEEGLDALKKAANEANEALFHFYEELNSAKQDLIIYKIKERHKAATDTTNELRKWSDLVQDPAFQAAWHNLFEIKFDAASPVDSLKARREAALALVNEFKGETSEVERFFDQMIQEAEAEWQSLVDKEQQIFDERLTPAQRLEKEKAEWLEKAERWGFNALEIVKFYDDKISEEQKKAEAERKAQMDARFAEEKRVTQEQLQKMEEALQAQERMDELFNPVFVQDTASGDIDQEVEAIQRLYDTQMSYLNKLLESADLTEEAYEGIEERILSLTVAFNSQMNVLKKEQD